VIAKAGDEIPVGQRIAFILAPGESLPTEAAPAGSAQPTTLGKANAAKSAVRTPSTLESAEARVGRVLASPAAKRIAHERGVDLATLKGSGPQGSILAEDVLRAADSTAAATATSKTDRIVPLSAVRRITGARMTQSKGSTPHFYLSVDIDMSAVASLRSGWDQSGESAAPSINDFTLYACARALKDFPAVNSSFVDQKIQLHADINLGMAVAIDDGLVVPVIRNADRLSLTELAAQSRLWIDKAQKKKLLPLDYEGGTFTVSNLGMLGVDSFIAIINPPQCAILAVGRVAPRVVVEDGMFAIKSLMSATLSADHRVIDGAIGARFLQQVKHYLEQGMS
jgi:pyruvate dehydrogenase E2 component (dihydrolipoamide acetyltransferase)